jgi:CheY-specific phosphatase CheX
MTFKKQVYDSIHLVHGPAEIGEVEAEEFYRQSKAWMLTPADIYIFDFAQTVKIHRAFYSVFLQLKRTLASNDKATFSLNLSEPLKEQLYDAGVLGAFRLVSSIEEAKKLHPLQKKDDPRSEKPHQKIVLEILTAFVQGAKKAFEIQCNTPVELKNPNVKKENQTNIALGSLVTLVSPKFKGNVALLFPKDVFLSIYRNLFDEVHTEITGDMEDAAAEVLNIVYDQAKTELNQKDFGLPRAFPQVLKGDQIARQATRPEKTMVLPLVCTAGTFYIEIESE